MLATSPTVTTSRCISSAQEAHALRGRIWEKGRGPRVLFTCPSSFGRRKCDLSSPALFFMNAHLGSRRNSWSTGSKTCMKSGLSCCAPPMWGTSRTGEGDSLGVCTKPRASSSWGMKTSSRSCLMLTRWETGGCFFLPLKRIYKVPNTCCVSNMDVCLEPFVSARTGPSTTLQEPQFFFFVSFGT